ncbi:MAG: small subunit ribosomal protein S16 [Bradymonadia bacterium]|jgi:small subunit ribosomal protein S16
MKEPNVVDIDLDRVDYWLGVGAQPSDRALALIKSFRAGATITNSDFTEQNRQHNRAAQEAALNCKPLPEPEAPKVEAKPEAAPAAEEAPAKVEAKEAPVAEATEAPAAEAPAAKATETTEG